jgi:beta-phosphoglucomutase-like phosphatase (HAD superfamily)
MRLENWFISNPDTSQQEVLKVPINQNLVVKGTARSGMTNSIEHVIDAIISDATVLFFDLDGTLVDTDYANFLAYRKAVDCVTKSVHDIVYDADRRFNRTVLKNALPNLTKEEYQLIISQKEKCYVDYLPETKLITETAEILYKYATSNTIVLVTNCRKDRALATLNYHNLTDKCKHLFFRRLGENGVKINKFQNAIQSLGIPPELIIAFENEVAEIADAKQAGIEIINP